jgi:hypothetical protein
MAGQNPGPGRLIAVDGSRGRDVTAAAEALAAGLRERGVECGVSRWDASGLFGDLMHAAPEDRRVSARTLALLYAADLVFRLRWEIRPALRDGRVVIAAPFIDTAVGLGCALGAPDDWLRDVLCFAEPAHWSIRTRERKLDSGWKLRPERGYPEFCATLLKASPAGLRVRRARGETVKWLDTTAKQGAAAVSRREREQILDAITNSQQALPVRSPLRSRTGHS